jgi:outer membrane protein assembly factor BamB
MKKASIFNIPYRFFISTSLSFLAISIPLVLNASPSWPMFHHDLQHTGRSPYKGANTPKLKWSFVGNYIESSPAIGSDTTIYFGSFSDKKVYAVGPNGVLKWSYLTGGGIWSSPAIGSDSILYIGSNDDKVYAINPDGNLKWSYTTGGDVWSSPIIGPDSTVYVGSSDGKLYAINPNTGLVKWSYMTQSVVMTSPAIGFDSTIYVAAGTHLYAVTFSGTFKWSYKMGGGTFYSSPAVGPDTTIYVGAQDGKLYAITPDGNLKWFYKIISASDSSVCSTPAIGLDSTIYVGASDHKLYAIRPDGSVKWSYPTGNMIWSSPAIGLDTTIYVGSEDTKLYAIGPDGSIKWSYQTSGTIEASSPAIGPDGTVYIGSDGGKLYAIGPATGIQEETGLPQKWGLTECFPNPAISTTHIKYTLPKTANVTLIICDVTGRTVRTLVSGTQKAGSYITEWDGRAGNGIYFIKISVEGGSTSGGEAGNFKETKKLILMK